MLFLKKFRWLFVAFFALLTAGAGLFMGKFREKDYIAQLYERRNFTLLDDQGEFFELKTFPSTRLLLLIFTPDGIHPSLVRPFAEFSSRLPELKRLGVDPMLVTRTNREIARNFKEAARFPFRLLVDTSGSVGRNVGIWSDMTPVNYWGYAVMDNEMRVFWASRESHPVSFDELMIELKKVSGGKN